MGRDSDASGGSANGGNGEGNSNEGRGGGERGGGGGSGRGGRGKNKGDFGGISYGGVGFGGAFGGFSSMAEKAAKAGASEFSGKAGASGNSGTPGGLRSIEDAHKGLSMAGPQLSRARDNAFATGLSYGIQALGMMGLPFAGAIAMGVKATRDYGRGYAERTSMERAADANGMGATGTGDSSPAGMDGGLSGISKPVAQAAAPTKAAASGNSGSGTSGAGVIMGADKRTGAGAGQRSKSTAVRGFGSGGLKI